MVKFDKERFEVHLAKTLKMIKEIKQGDSMHVFYMKIFETIYEFKKSFPEEYFKEPVKIRQISRAIGGNLIETRFNSGQLAYTHLDGDIMLPQNISDNEKRYILAYEVSIKLINIANNNRYTHICKNDLQVLKDFNEVIAKAMACYILIPIESFLSLNQKCIERRKKFTGESSGIEEEYFYEQMCKSFDIPLLKICESVEKINNVLTFFYLKMLHDNTKVLDNDLFFGKNSFYENFKKNFNNYYKAFILHQ